jgi:hypothetical protein
MSDFLFDVSTKECMGVGYNRLHVYVCAGNARVAFDLGVKAYNEELKDVDHTVEELDKLSDSELKELDSREANEEGDNVGRLIAIYRAAKGEVTTEIVSVIVLELFKDVS